MVVEAPSTASGADAQSLARVADAAILVVETGRTRHAQVVDAAQQFRLVGTRLLGAVLLSPPLPEPKSRVRADRTAGRRMAGRDPPIVDAPTNSCARSILRPPGDADARLLVVVRQPHGAPPATARDCRSRRGTLR